MNPAISMWLNLALTAAGAVAGADPSILTGVGGSSAVQWAGIATAILGVLNSALHATSPSTPGPAGK